jgi:ABC-type amino acid transport substrate-binding protein
MIKLLTGLLALAVTAGAHAETIDTLKRIRDAKTVTLGYRTDSPPFSFAQDGQPAGYSVDLCKRVVTVIERAVNLTPLAVKWVPLNAANRFDQVSKGAVDLECGNTSATLSRMERFDFSNLIFVDSGALLVLQDTQIGRLSDVGGKTVGVVAGTTTEQSLKSALKERLVDAKIVSLKDEAEAMSALQSKQIDAYAGDRVKLVGLIVVARSDVKYRLVQDDFTFEPYALMMRRDPAFRLVVNRGLAQIYRSGAVTEIYDRWLARLGKPGPLLVAMYYLNAIPE